MVAGQNVEYSTSCGNDVEDVLVVEVEDPVDNPGTTVGTWFSALHLGSVLLSLEL